MKKLNFTTQNKAAHVRKKNKDFLDLLDVATKARLGFVGEQSRLVSRPAKESATQILRQIDLINNLVSMPHILLVAMEGRVEGLKDAFLGKLGQDANKRELKKRKLFEAGSKQTMRHFFSLDTYMRGGLSGPWLFAITVYTWTTFECLAGDLWANSLNPRYNTRTESTHFPAK